MLFELLYRNIIGDRGKHLTSYFTILLFTMRQESKHKYRDIPCFSISFGVILFQMVKVASAEKNFDEQSGSVYLIRQPGNKLRRYSVCNAEICFFGHINYTGLSCINLFRYMNVNMIAGVRS